MLAVHLGDHLAHLRTEHPSQRRRERLESKPETLRQGAHIRFFGHQTRRDEDPVRRHADGVRPALRCGDGGRRQAAPHAIELGKIVRGRCDKRRIRRRRHGKVW